jgi:hypothetical protein
MLALSHQFEIGMATMFVAAASYSLAAESDITVPPETRPLMLAMPRPTYPEEARAQRITGRGLYDVFIDPPTGVVTRRARVRRSSMVRRLTPSSAGALDPEN